MIRAQTALLSAYDKNDRLRDFAKELIGLNWKILASKGTKEFLDRYGISSTDVGDLVGPPILGHRVVTLDRKIYAAILARRDNPDDMAELERIGVDPIGLVYVDLYPLAKELAKPQCTYHSALENIDIGGVTLLRAAAKGKSFVVSSADQFKRVLQFLEAPPDPREPMGLIAGNRFISELAADAERKAANYSALASEFYASVADGEFPQRWQHLAA